MGHAVSVGTAAVIALFAVLAIGALVIGLSHGEWVTSSIVMLVGVIVFAGGVASLAVINLRARRIISRLAKTVQQQ